MKDFFNQRIRPYAVKYWKYAAGVLAALLVLVFAFWYGGNSSGSHGWEINGYGTETGQSGSLETDGQADDILSSAEAGSQAVLDSAAQESNSASGEASGSSGSTAGSSEAADISRPESGDGQSSGSQTAGSSGSASVTGSGSNTGNEGQGTGGSTGSGSGTGGSTGGNNTVPGGSAVENSLGAGGSTGVSSPETGAGTAPADNSGTASNTCTLSVSCATVLNNMDMLDKSKKDIIPADGCILTPVTVSFSDGETVFDVLAREMRNRGIQLEYSYTPLYGSCYIEGIYNLYEFDCGDLSGWMYSVNGVFPNYGCSGYVLKDGDVIQFAYTCDLGFDVGGGYATGE